MRKLLVAFAALFATQSYAGELLLHGLSIHNPDGWTETRKTDRYVTYEYQYQTGPNTYAIGTATVYVGTETTKTYRKYNHANLGVGYITDDRWMFGTYKNSIGKRTAYFGKQFPLFDTNLSVNLAAATGYSSMDGGRKVMPMVAFDYKVHLVDKYNLHTTLVPKINSDTATAVMLSVGRDF